MVLISNNIIKITQGDTLRTLVMFFLRPGILYEPTQGDRIRFALKDSKDANNQNVLINIDIPIETMELVIPASETKKVPSRNTPYFYDVEITFADGTVYTFIPEGRYYSMPEVI